jgi:alpha,alpha-trehalose-phosphate synthase [UDP-forming]
MRRLNIRLIVSLILGITLVSLIFSYFEVLAQKRSLRQDLEHRAEVLAESLAQNVEPYFGKGSRRLQEIVGQFGNREHLAGVAIYDRQGVVLAETPGLGRWLATQPHAATQSLANNHGTSEFVRKDNNALNIYALPLRKDQEILGTLVIVHDASYIDAQKARIWRDTFLRVLVEVFLIALITLLIVRWSITGPIARAAQWMRAQRTGRASPHLSENDLLHPLAKEVANFAQSLTAARYAAEKEAELRDAAESIWTAERLSVHVRSRLQDGRLFVVSNREPYIHTRHGKTVEVLIPASGLVTALEPVLCACDGTWIAHGSGDADREVVGPRDRLRVPPDDHRYTLRRVWLTKEEEEGYYYGFANEGLWPLCHIAHTRPIFRSSDWEHYRVANQKFADAVLEEMEGIKRPVLLTQDYHFALLPRIIKKARPDARVAIFWHIPWPTAEAFSICPWQRELLDGLLGADLIGFHIQSHCNNFLQTVDRTLESRIEWEHFAVNREEHRTTVMPFPISVEFEEPAPGREDNSSYEERAALLREMGLEATYLGVGVDRIDYTKGILERFLAVESLLEKHPFYRGKFTFIQIGAPSRTHIKRYHDLIAEVEAEVERINWKFAAGKWKPIVFRKGQHNHDEIGRFYRSADLCLVTALHDGMNLVAKEFVAARDDEQGVLILSVFTGAARELWDALLVNPYDIEQTAAAIHTALQMEAEDRKVRMQRMRKTVREQNVYRWAANLIGSLCEVRLEKPEPRSTGIAIASGF